LHFVYAHTSPYNFYWKEHQSHSNYQLPHLNFWQEPMQVSLNLIFLSADFNSIYSTAFCSHMQFQCLYRAKKYSISWIITTDVDEYIFVKQSNHTLQGLINKVSSKWGDLTQVGALELHSIPFGRNPQVEEVTDYNHTLVIDYVWRQKKELDAFIQTRQKMVYHVGVAQSVGIHYLWNGGHIVELSPKEDAYIRHYKRPNEGVFGGKNAELMRDSELPDKLRETLLHAMQ
jgi:hypothetical protein